MSRTWYPARINGVASDKIPSGAVASVLENAGKKKTTFLDRDRTQGFLLTWSYKDGYQ
ncbi:MAG TPA: hypothetical protein VKR43_09760 [Bryobacteraceae bacterium]|nr:hypothetical protein [Bryobacteraceae bacterium]